MEKRFNIPPETFDDYLLFSRQKSWSLIKKGGWINLLSSLKVSRVGLKAFQKVGPGYVKPTTRMIQCFGRLATKNIIDINSKQLDDLINGEKLEMALGDDKGYVIIRLKNHVILGLGFYAQGKLSSQLPKKELRSRMLVCGKPINREVCHVR